jgi:hypothetical protein
MKYEPMAQHQQQGGSFTRATDMGLPSMFPQRDGWEVGYPWGGLFHEFISGSEKKIVDSQKSCKWNFGIAHMDFEDASFPAGVERCTDEGGVARISLARRPYRSGIGRSMLSLWSLAEKRATSYVNLVCLAKVGDMGRRPLSVIGRN